MYVDIHVRPQGEQVDALAPSKMKLSTAIRIGAKLRPQCTEVYWRDGGSCAIGAALEAIGYEYGKFMVFSTVIFRHFPEMGKVGSEIFRLNDKGHSRESIATWLESLGL